MLQWVVVNQTLLFPGDDFSGGEEVSFDFTLQSLRNRTTNETQNDCRRRKFSPPGRGNLHFSPVILMPWAARENLSAFRQVPTITMMGVFSHHRLESLCHHQPAE
jgi:hypothetical protein